MEAKIEKISELSKLLSVKSPETGSMCHWQPVFNL